MDPQTGQRAEQWPGGHGGTSGWGLARAARWRGGRELMTASRRARRLIDWLTLEEDGEERERTGACFVWRRPNIAY